MVRLVELVRAARPVRRAPVPRHVHEHFVLLVGHRVLVDHEGVQQDRALGHLVPGAFVVAHDELAGVDAHHLLLVHLLLEGHALLVELLQLLLEPFDASHALLGSLLGLLDLALHVRPAGLQLLHRGLQQRGLLPEHGEDLEAERREARHQNRIHPVHRHLLPGARSRPRDRSRRNIKVFMKLVF